MTDACVRVRVRAASGCGLRACVLLLSIVLIKILHVVNHVHHVRCKTGGKQKLELRAGRALARQGGRHAPPLYGCAPLHRPPVAAEAHHRRPLIHQHNARESARRRAQHDAFGADRGAPWRNPTNGGG